VWFSFKVVIEILIPARNKLFFPIAMSITVNVILLLILLGFFLSKL
jgi:hypothetical protein